MMKSRSFYCLWVFSVLFPYSMDLMSGNQIKESMLIDSFLQKQKKYLNGGTMELVSFYAQEAEDTHKGLIRNAILYKNPKARATVLVCHGFMCNKNDISFLRRYLFDRFHVMFFDFRAHGEKVDADQCCTFGKDEAYDVVGAVNYLKSRTDLHGLPRIAYGFSMGAVAAIQAQALDDTLFHAMILDCPYDKSENLIKQSLAKLKISFFGYTFDLPGRSLLEKYAFHPYVQSVLKTLLKSVANMDATGTNSFMYPLSPVDSIKQVTVPCFFIHCRNDEKVSIDSIKNVYSNAPGYKRLWITNGRRHFDSFLYNPDKYVYKVNRFITAVITGQWLKKQQAKIVADINDNRTL